jgi:type II restriction enzyme
MGKIKEAQQILKALGLPPAQYNEMAGLTFLAICNIKENGKWKNASRKSMGVTKGIMTFVYDYYGRSYAPNTRETFRRKVLHQFVQARLVDYNPDKPDLPVNSPNAHYALTKEALVVVKAFKTKEWKKALENFVSKIGKLTETYNKVRELDLIPVSLQNGGMIKLSAGKHNQVQAAIVEQFAPRFVKDGILLYLGDTAKKNLFVDEKELKKLNIPIDQHSKLPDVVIYDSKRNWLFLIEAVTSHGPVSPKRLIELEAFLKNCTVGKIYVTAFADIAEFKKHSNNIAWETEVWLMETPDHMIHFNGDRFVGPR